MDIKELISSWQKQINLRESDTPLVRWCIVVTLILLVWFWLIEPLQVWHGELDQQVTQNAKKAARLLSLKEDAKSWAEAEEGAKAALEGGLKQLLTQSTDTAAQAKLQTLLQQQCEARNITIESQKLIPGEAEEGLGRKLAVAMNLRGELADVLYLLDDLSRANQLLLIDRWVMRMERNEQIFAQLVVAGIRADNQDGTAENES